MNAQLQPLTEHHLKVEPATVENVAPFGALLGRRSGVQPTLSLIHISEPTRPY